MKKTLLKLIWYIRGGYKPREFWDEWSKTFMDDPWQVQTHAQHVWILEKLRISSPKSILEVGCGFGRNIKFFIEQGYAPENISGIDISSNMIHKAKKYIQNNKVVLQTSPINKMPFKDKTFDVVFVHGVFMHVKPKDLEASFAEVIRVCKKYIICVEQNKNGNEYTFIHDYKKLFSHRSVKMIEYKKKNKLELDFIYAKIRKK